MQEKSSASGGHPERSKPQQPFRVNDSYLNVGNSIGSPAPGTNPNPFNIFSGGSTSQMPTSPPFNPFATCSPTSDIGGGYNPMSFGMQQYEKFGVNPGMPNFSYGWNERFPYTPYPIRGYQPNNMMQYSMPGNAFGFGGPFSTPFSNNETLSMRDKKRNHCQATILLNSSRHCIAMVLVAKLKGNNLIPPIALMNYFVDGLLPNYCNKIKLHLMRSYEQVHNLAFEYENQVEIEGDPSQKFYAGRDPTCWNINRGDPKPKETPKSKEAETIKKLTADIERMIIQVNKKGDVKERQSKKMGKSEEGSKNVNYQATYEDDIPLIRCPRCMTWGHGAKNCPHKDFKGVVCMQCGPGDHKMKDFLRNGKTSNLFSHTLDNEENYDVNICMRSNKKKNTIQEDTDFPNPQKEKNRFMVAKEALETVAKEAQAKREATKKAEEELE
eukprot:Gb_36966 [translate_table: standard]